MALSNSSQHPVPSQLSVDAASFIPCQMGPPAYENHEQKAGHQGQATPIMPPPSTTNQLPSYVVNCYPFMDMELNTRFSGGGVALSPGHLNMQRKLVNGHVPSLILQKPPALVSEGNPFHVDVHCPPPVNPSLMTPQFLSATVINPPPLPVPVFGHLPQQSRTTAAAYPHAPAVGPLPPQAYLGISPSLFGFNQSLQYIHGIQVPGCVYSSSSQTRGIWFPHGQEKSEDKAAKTPPKTKVIVCKDNSAQTDFNDELAQLTLAEKPNTLFIKDQATQGTDSDSGYSSPLHRKHQTTSIVPSPPRTSTFRPPPAPSLPPPQPVSQVTSQHLGFPSLAGPVFPHVLPPTFPIPQFTGIVYPSPMPVYGSGESVMNQPLSTVNRFSGIISNDHRSWVREKQKSDRRTCEGSSAVPVSKPLAGSVAEVASRPQQTACNSVCPSTTPTVSSGDQDMRLPFEDEDEFPILLSAAGGLVAQGECFGASSLSYGEILRSPSTQPTSRSRRSSASSSDKRRSGGSVPLSGSPAALVPGLAANKDSKSARKKQKRQLLAYQAAEEELAEICLEQQMLKELSTKQQKRQLLTVTDKASAPKVLPPAPVLSLPEMPSAAPSVATVPKPSPPLFNIEDVIEQLEKEKSAEERAEMDSPTQDSSKTAAILDSAGTMKRAKEREFSNKKKPSSLKRVILKEREAKKCHNILDDCSSLLPDGAGAVVNGDATQSEGGGLLESMTGQAPTSAEMSPVSQMSPINMSPLSGSPAGSAGASPIAGDGALGSGRSSVVSKIHSRRFREYCNQVLDKEIDDCCTELLQDLVRVQDRLYHDDPTKAKSKRRFVLGLREVTKHLKLGKLKCIIISPNLERIQSKGGLDEALNTIIEMSQKQDVPFVFALGRRALGRACAKLVPVSVVGVFSYEGSEEHFFKLRDLTQKAREAYSEMVASLEREMAAAEPPATNTISTTAGSFEKLFPHLGHSRTPSACSAISFISSILSEPISENYPQSEPETDSRGYEIRLENRKPDLDTVGEGREEAVEPETEDKKAALNDEDIDDGHEADTEEDGLYSQRFSETINPAMRESKEKLKSESESCTEYAPKLDPAGSPSAPVIVRSEGTCGGHLATSEPGATNSSAKVPVQVALSTSERSERIESWVAESQRVTKQLRELSSEVPAAAVNADEESGEDEEEDDEEVDEDAASLKTVEDDSSSEYEETTEVPYNDTVAASP